MDARLQVYEDKMQKTIKNLMEEFGSREIWQANYGGDTPQALSEAYRRNLRFANTLQPEYLVFHVSECTMAESMYRRYHYTDEQVCDAVIDLDQMEVPTALREAAAMYCGGKVDGCQLSFSGLCRDCLQLEKDA